MQIGTKLVRLDPKTGRPTKDQAYVLGKLQTLTRGQYITILQSINGNIWVITPETHPLWRPTDDQPLASVKMLDGPNPNQTKGKIDLSAKQGP